MKQISATLCTTTKTMRGDFVDKRKNKSKKLFPTLDGF